MTPITRRDRAETRSSLTSGTARGRRPVSTLRSRLPAGRPGGRTPAQWYLFVSGLLVVLFGIAGAFVDNSFDLQLHTTHPGSQPKLFGIFMTNGWHNLAAVLAGAFALAMHPTRHARRAAAHVGIAYGVLTVAVALNVPLLLSVDTYGNLVHLGLAVAGLASAALTPSHRTERRAAEAARREPRPR